MKTSHALKLNGGAAENGTAGGEEVQKPKVLLLALFSPHFRYAGHWDTRLVTYASHVLEI